MIPSGKVDHRTALDMEQVNIERQKTVATLTLCTAKLEAHKRRAETQHHLAFAVFKRVIEPHGVPEAIFKNHMQSLRDFSEAEASLMTLEIAEIQSKLKILDAMIKEAKDPTKVIGVRGN